jgi:hypothetical protein
VRWWAMPWDSVLIGTTTSEFRKDYGNWITGYTNPKPGRYHSGMKAGRLSQTGLILVILPRSVIERGKYQEADFTTAS